MDKDEVERFRNDVDNAIRNKEVMNMIDVLKQCKLIVLNQEKKIRQLERGVMEAEVIQDLHTDIQNLKRDKMRLEDEVNHYSRVVIRCKSIIRSLLKRQPILINENILDGVKMAVQEEVERWFE